jgi:hypothetical protein
MWKRRGTITVGGLVLIALCTARQIAFAKDPIWDAVKELGDAIALNEFCAKHPGHTRCKDLEALRVFCAAHPMDAERCDPPSAAKLLQECNSDSSTDHAACAGVLDAMVDSGAAPQMGSPVKLNAPEPALACVPVAVLDSPDQLRILFVREAYRHPEVLHLPARRLLFYALAKTFPCINPLQTKP